MTTKASHTPGPWSIGTGWVYAGILPLARSICSGVGVGGEDDANAKLISAAPDLLAACRVVLDELYHAEDTMEPVREMLRAAIAKAEDR